VAANLEIAGSLSGLLAITGVYSEYRVTLMLDDPDVDGTAGIMLQAGSVTDPAGNPVSAAYSPLCEVFNWHGFLEEPQNALLYQGGTHTLSAQANCGAAGLLYQWKWEDGMKGIHDGPQAAAWLLENVTPAMAGVYWCEVSYDGLTHATTSASVSVELPLEVVQAPENGTIYEGDSYLFSVEVAGGYAPISYHWEKDGVAISDAPAVSLENAALDDGGLYTVIVSDANIAQLTLAASLVVLPVPVEGEPEEGEGEDDPCSPDMTPPEVMLAGDSEVVLENCELYEEYGLASVIDACDGDLSLVLTPTDVWVNIWAAATSLYVNTTLNSVELIFNVLYGRTSGEYALVYNIKDTSGNEVLTERFITVNCEPVEGEGEPVEGEVIEGETIEGEGETIEGELVEGEVIEGEGEPVEGEGELVEGEVIEGEGETVEGEGELVEGEVIEGEAIEGEGEAIEGEPVEGEPVEGEGETDVDDIADTLFEEFENADLNDDGLLDFTEAQNIIDGLTEDQFNALDTDGDGFLSLVELAQLINKKCIPVLTVRDAAIDCADYETAQNTITAAFESIHAEDGCGTALTDAVRVRRITWIGNGRIERLDLEAIAETSRGFDDSPYDYSITATRKLFHLYLLFRPGYYDIEYITQKEDGTRFSNFESKKTQRIFIDDACKGCFGCNQHCAGCREQYIPCQVQNLKQYLSNILLNGIALLTLASMKYL